MRPDRLALLPALAGLLFAPAQLEGAERSAAAMAPHVRTEDAAVKWLVASGAEYSPTFKRLVSDLDGTDVVAYVTVDATLPRSLGGKIAFVTSAAGLRYLLITVLPDDDPKRAIALLGHELAHAREVAADPAIVDVRSMMDAYLTGLIRMRSGKPIADTWNARAVQAQIAEELRSRHSMMTLDFDNVRRALPRPGPAKGAASPASEAAVDKPSTANAPR